MRPIIIIIALVISSLGGFLIYQLTKPSTQEKVYPFNHVITLVMENHSFDNILGFSKFGTLKDQEFCNEHDGNQYCTTNRSGFQTTPDPPHGFQDIHVQLYGDKDTPFTATPNMSGFAENYSTRGDPQISFNSYKPQDVPIISTLAEEFTICDNWYSAVPGPTYPNKYFFHVATSHGQTANCDYPDCQGIPFEAQSIYQNLEDEGYSWQIYWQDWMEVFSIYPLNQKKENLIQDQYFEQFLSNLKNGKLADYTYIVPKAYWNADQVESEKNQAEIDGHAPNTEHPCQDVRAGERLIKDIYEALRASEFWNDTLLIITYDEHGGFPDHVIPPGGVPNPSPEVTSYPDQFDFNRLGVRVPGLLISPWMKKGYLDSTQYEHASVPHTIKDIFDLSADYLTSRDKFANGLLNSENLLENRRDDCIEVLPEIESFEKVPLENPVFNGLPNPEVNIMLRLLISEGLISVTQAYAIRDQLLTESEGLFFCNEAYAILGYKPFNYNVPFKYLEFLRTKTVVKEY